MNNFYLDKDSVNLFLFNLGVPKGFKRIKWEETKNGQTVYLWGSRCISGAGITGPS